ncbi:MAG: NAD(P)H-binding protein, partial [Bacteroidota bacterium]
MKTAVTLASGQLGAAIAQQLVQQLGKDQVMGIARTPEKAAQLGIEIREGDYNHREHFDQALQGVDVVVIVSGNAHPQARIQQHRNVIEAAKLNVNGRPLVVGHSFGGYITLAAVEREGEKLSGAVVIDSAMMK